MRLSYEFKARMRAEADLRADKKLAITLRGSYGEDLGHLDDAGLTASIHNARKAADSFGIEDTDLRMRFILLGAVHLPEFWNDGLVRILMNAQTGTADARFGDVCAFLKLGAVRAGNQDEVWW